MTPSSAAAPASGFARGAAWSAVNAAAAVALPFAVFIAFARWLAPSEVGAIVLATSLAEIVKAFGAPGLYEALLNEGAEDRRCHETAMAVLLCAGAALTAIFVAVMAVAANFVPAVADAGWMLDLVGLRILFDLAMTQPQAALAQRLAFGRMAARSIAANSGAGALGIAAALAGRPFEGMVLYLVAQSALTFAVTAAGRGVLARPVFHRDRLARMRREASAASVVRLVGAVNNYLDQVVVAAAIGAARLAFFNVGKRVETTFVTAAASFSTILFQPLFSSRSAAGRASGLRHGLAMLTLLCGAPAAFVAADSDPVVRLVFGERWREAAPVVAILACGGFARALGSVHGALLSVSRRNRELMRVSVASAAAGLAIVLLLSGWGIGAVAAGLAAKSVATSAWMAALTRRDLPRLGRVYLSVVAAPFCAMAAAAWASGLALAPLLAPMPADGPAGAFAGLLASGAATLAAGGAVLAVVLPLPDALRAAIGLAPARPPSWSIETP